MLYGAACPVGSRTSCCEFFMIFRQKSSFSLTLSSAFILSSALHFSCLSAFAFFHVLLSINPIASPLFYSSIQSALYPCVVSQTVALPVRIHTSASNICFIHFLIFSPLMPLHFSASFSTLAPSQPLPPLHCHFSKCGPLIFIYSAALLVALPIS